MKTSLVDVVHFFVKNVKLASGHVTLIEKRSDAQRTKQMHNVNIQVFTSAGTLGVEPVDLSRKASEKRGRILYGESMFYADELAGKS